MSLSSPRFHQACLIAALLLGVIFASGAVVKPALADEQRVNVMLDQAKLLKMPDHVDTVVVGSPIIADVTMLKKNGLVVVTGKGFGSTNVIFLDANGQALSEALVTVTRAPTLVTVQRGLDQESYSCTPRCEPTVALGDATKFLSDATGQITSRNGLAAQTH